jgi:hypothetical protein
MGCVILKKNLRYIIGLSLLTLYSAGLISFTYYFKNSENKFSEQNSTNKKYGNSSRGSLSKPKSPKEKDKAKIPKDFIRLKDKFNLVEIPTYDDSYQLTHPKVLYFSEGWNHYKYWMSMTPYPQQNDYFENPSIVVSNDGVTGFSQMDWSILFRVYPRTSKRTWCCGRISAFIEVRFL